MGTVLMDGADHRRGSRSNVVEYTLNSPSRLIIGTNYVYRTQ